MAKKLKPELTVENIRQWLVLNHWKDITNECKDLPKNEYLLNSPSHEKDYFQIHLINDVNYIYYEEYLKQAIKTIDEYYNISVEDRNQQVINFLLKEFPLIKNGKYLDKTNLTGFQKRFDEVVKENEKLRPDDNIMTDEIMIKIGKNWGGFLVSESKLRIEKIKNSNK